MSSITLLAIAFIMILMPMTASATYFYESPPYASRVLTHVDTVTRNGQPIDGGSWAYVYHYVTPWARASDGHFGSESVSQFTSVELTNVIVSCSATMGFYSKSFTPPAGTRSYTLNCMWNVQWHARMNMNSGAGSAYGLCKVDVTFGFWDVYGQYWVGSTPVTNNMATWYCYPGQGVDRSGSFGATGAAWTLTAGRTYQAYGIVTSLDYLWSGYGLNWRLTGYARTDIWNNGDARLPNFLIAY
jgi:hypothetical protein